MEFLSYVVVFVIAAWIGWHMRGIVFLANLSENPDRVIEMLKRIKEINEEEANGNPEAAEGVEILPEQVGNMWYAYAKHNNQFLGQGSSLEDAIQMATKRFPNKKFWCKNPTQV